MRLRPTAASERVLLRRTEKNQTEQDEPKEREEGISCMVKKPFRCLIGMKEFEAGRDNHAPRIYQYIPPGSFPDAVGIEPIHKEKSEKNKSRMKEKRSAELKEVSPTSVATLLSNHRLEKKAAGEESSSLNRSLFTCTTNPFGRNHFLEDPKESQAVSLFARNGSFEEPPFGLEALPQLEKMRTLSLLTRKRSQSFEGAPPPNLDELPQIERKLSFVDAIPTPTKNDPLDSHSIRDVQKALREMERKLNAADTEGKRVSRSKVMKALLTVVDQLDEDYDYSPEVKVITDRPSNSLSLDDPLSPPMVATNDRVLSPPAVTRISVLSSPTSPAASVISSHKSLATTVVSSQKSPATNAIPGLASPHDPKRVMTPTEELCRNWAGPSFDGNIKQRVETAPVQENRAIPPRRVNAFASNEVTWKDWPSSLSKRDDVKAAPTAETEEVDLHSSDEASRDSSSGSSGSSSAASNEQETIFSGESTHGESTHFSDKPKTKKVAFSHAKAPRRRGFDDFFHLDMNDPVVKAGVKDALCDLMWIPSFQNTPKIEEPKKNRPKSSVPASRQKTMLDKLRAESVDWYKEEEDESELAYRYEDEESTPDTTRSSSGREETHDRSWWRRSRSLKPPSNDTKPIEHQTKVTVASSDKWKEILY